MTMSLTPRYALPLLTAGQAQKELSHNEALILLDALVHPVAQSIGETVPPDDAQPGECWVVGDEPAGAWSGAAGTLAIWTGNGWRFVGPREGMSVQVADSGMVARSVDGVWQTGIVRVVEIVVGGERVIAARQPAIGDASGGTTIDVEARTALNGVLAALRTHGLIAS